MAKRIIKACAECNYSLTEQVNLTVDSPVVVANCICPQCNGKAKHFMFIDKGNMPDADELLEGNKRAKGICDAVNKV